MTSLEKECDALCRKIVKKRAGYRCQVPKCERAATDTVHIIDRDVQITRYDLSNMYGGCRQHHDHDRHNELTQQHILVVGKEEYERLKLLSRQHKIWHEWKLKELRDRLKEMV